MDNKPQQQNNLDQLRNLAKILGTTVVTQEQLDQVFQGIITIVSSYKNDTAQLNAETKQVLDAVFQKIVEEQDRISNDIAATTEDNASFKTVIQKNFDTKINEVKALLVEVQHLKPKDGKDARPEDVVPLVLAQLPPVEKVEIDTAEQVRDKLETLEGDDRLDKKAIRGLDKVIERSDLDRAVSLLDSRSSYLINKVSALEANPGLNIGDAIGGFTPGSVAFAGPGGKLAQDNTNFFWDDTNDQLQIGPSAGFDGNSQIGLSLSKNVNNYSGIYAQNKSTGDTASTDIILGADNDNVAIAGHYIDVGIQGSGFLPSALGIIKTVSVTAGGSGYTVGDILTLATGDVNATVQVLTRSGTAVATVSIVSNGTNYTTGTKATTGGTGTGCTINATALYDFTGLTANDGYLYTEGGNQLIGTDSPSKVVKVLTGGFAADNQRAVINDNGMFIGGYTGFSTNTFGATALQYSTGTASRSTTTITGIGTTFTADMVGSHFTFADGTDGGTITAFGSATSLTVSASGTVAAQKYRISYLGVQVTSTGNVGIGNASPTSKLHVTGTGTYGAAGISGIRSNAHTVTLSGANPTTYATFHANQLGPMTLVGTNTNQTVTDAATLNINGAPIKSTNVALTNTYGIMVATGAVSTATNSYGLFVQAMTGATNNYGAVFSTGNVGVGTSAPAARFHVGSTSGGLNTGILLEQLAENGGPTSSYVSIDLKVPTTGITGQLFATANNYVNASTNFAANGIGINAAATGGQLVLAAGSATGYISFDTGGVAPTNERMRIIANGNVGIGTTAPTNILSFGNASSRTIWIENSATDVIGRALTINGGSTVAGTSVSDVTGGSLILNAGLGTGTGTSSIFFQTGTTLTTGTTLQTLSTKMTILGSGNVGIGTTGPTAQLHIVRANSTAGNILLQDSGSGDAAVTFNVSGSSYIIGIDQSDSGKFKISNSTTLGTTDVVTLSGSNLGIGTASPSGVLSISGFRSASSWTTAGINLQTAAATYTDTSSAAAATVATRTVNSFGIPTLDATNALTAVTNASNIYIAGAPVQSANSPITNTHALYIAAGAVGTATASYGLTVNTQTGATNNYAAAFLGGNVGMGTATPTLTTKLQLIDTSSGTSIFSRNTTLTLQNTDTTTNNWTGIGNYSPSGSVASGISFQNYDVSNSYSNISFTTRGATGFNRDVMTIKDVNVGIGTTAPSTSLDVSGTTGLTVGVPTASVGVETGGMLFLRRRDTSITANVNLGRIDFTGDDAVAVNTAGASIRGYAETTWTNTDNGSRIAFYTVANTTTTLSEKMRIDNAGNVGIGQTSPTAVLHLKAGTATASTAPLKFTSGPLLTVPEAGALGFLTDLYYGTTTTGTKRGAFSLNQTGRSTAQTAAVASVATFTLPATDGSFRIAANVLVTTSSAENFTVTCAYTDEGNTARTVTLNFQSIAGTIGTAINFASGAVPYEGIPITIRAKASTAITIATTGTFTGATYNVEGFITQLA